MKKVFYLHGLNGQGGCKSGTGKCIIDALGEGWEVVSPTLDLIDVKKVMQTVKDASNDCDLMVGTSFGAFYVLAFGKGPRIVTNPCLKPSEEIPRLAEEDGLDELSEEDLDILRDYENKLNGDDVKILMADSDEVFGDKFLHQASNLVRLENLYSFHGHHGGGSEDLVVTAKQAAYDMGIISLDGSSEHLDESLLGKLGNSLGHGFGQGLFPDDSVLTSKPVKHTEPEEVKDRYVLIEVDGGDEYIIENIEPVRKLEFGEEILFTGPTVKYIKDRLAEMKRQDILDVVKIRYRSDKLTESVLREHFVTIFTKKPEDQAKIEKYGPEIYDILQKGYADIGGIEGCDSYEDLVNDSDLWKINCKNGEPLAVAIYTHKRGGRKLQYVSRKQFPNDKEKDSMSKQALYQMVDESINAPGPQGAKNQGVWGEVSDGPIGHIYDKYGKAPTLSPEDMAVMLPDKDLIPSEDGVHYDRKIGKNMHTKYGIGFKPKRYNNPDYVEKWLADAAAKKSAKKENK